MEKKDSKQPQKLDINYFFSLLRENVLLYGIVFICFVGIAYAINKFSKPVYKIQTALVINEEGNSFSNASSSLLEGIGIPAPNKNFANELQSIKSTPLIREALKQLDFNISYYYHQHIQVHELYKATPFIVIINKDHPQPINVRFHVRLDNNGYFQLSAKSDQASIYSFVSENITQIIPDFTIKGRGEFDKMLVSDNYSFKIILNTNYNLVDYSSNHFSFQIHNTSDLAYSYKSQLKVSPPDLESTIANVAIESTVPNKQIDFLNVLVKTYLTRDFNRKVFISHKTIEYIDNQLNVVKDSLQVAEEQLQRYRSTNRVLDISLQSGRVFDEMQELEREKADLLVKQKYFNYISNYFNENQEYSDLITPAGMGITDPLLNNMIEELITLNSEKVTFIENNQEKSPYLKKINIRIDNLKSMITENITYVQNTSNIAIKDIESRISQLNREIQKLPKTQRELIGMERKFNLNDAIYTFLLQRRAEAEISKASYQSDMEVIEPATVVGGVPIAPDKKLNYLIAIFLAFLIPTVYLRVRDILKNNFSKQSELENLSILPIIGKIYKNNKKVDTVVSSFPNSHVAESFRILRSNLNYFFSNDKQSRKILITSTISQEGKSFISLNLAISLANAHKKTVLLGFDLRKPKIYERIEMSEKAGLSSYLSDQASFEDIIQPSNIKNLDVAYAGKVPPNPSDLITSDRINQLFEALETNYEYIIMDTAPIGIVSETFDLIEFADLKIFVVRLNYSPKKEVMSLIEDFKEKSLSNTAIVTNDIPVMKKTKFGYGYYEQS